MGNKSGLGKGDGPQIADTGNKVQGIHGKNTEGVCCCGKGDGCCIDGECCD